MQKIREQHQVMNAVKQDSITFAGIAQEHTSRATIEGPGKLHLLMNPNEGNSSENEPRVIILGPRR
jgi:hypothetical protein